MRDTLAIISFILTLIWCVSFAVFRIWLPERRRLAKREQDYQEALNRRADEARIELARLRSETPSGPIRSNSPPKRTVPDRTESPSAPSSNPAHDYWTPLYVAQLPSHLAPAEACIPHSFASDSSYSCPSPSYDSSSSSSDSGSSCGGGGCD